jgi:hypothetical protein
MNTPRIRTTLLIALAGGLTIGTAHAQLSSTVVQWGGAGDTVIVNNGLFGPNINSTVLNLASPKAGNATGAGYYMGDPTRTDRSVVVYAGAWTSSTATGSQANFRLLPANFAVWHPAVFDSFILNTDSGAGGTPHSTAGIALWQKNDGFLNRHDTGTLSFAELNIRLNIANNSEADADKKSNHIVVRDGANFFVSNNIGGGLANLTQFTLFESAESLVTSWFQYDPTTDITAVGGLASPALNDITAIGLLNLGTDLPIQFYSTMIAEFTVTAVPEPSTYALVFGLGVMGLVVWRRRHSR